MSNSQEQEVLAEEGIAPKENQSENEIKPEAEIETEAETESELGPESESESNADSLPTDPVAQALAQRASDLSLALKPEAVARKLRDELEEKFPGVANLYHISAELVGSDLQFLVAMKTPDFGLQLSTDGRKSASLGFYIDKQLDGGWKLELGLEVSGSFKPPEGSRVVSGGKFSVTLSR